MLRVSALIFLLVAAHLHALSSFAQQKKTDAKQEKADEHPKKNGELKKKVTKQVKGWVHQNPADTLMDKKSELAYKKYAGRTIRKITIHHIGFERDINDTTRYKIINKAARVANSLHSNTKVRVIKNNLFIRENKSLDPYKLADNERHLRDLDFIVDARIVVKPVRGNRELVDVVVYTRDVFSLGGSLSPRSPTEVGFKIYDANLSGWGQRTEFRGLVDTEREPPFGMQLLYRKNSIKGTFINATVSYSQLNNGASYGLENESALYLKLDRPLVSPYTRWAGGLQLSRNWSVNAFHVSEPDFRQYSYDVKDFWIGYNMGIRQKAENRNRYFVAIRTFGQQFIDRPTQSSELENPIYNNVTYGLSEFTYYKQNFYRTKYVYGFGRTEDVPYGRSLTVLVGQVKQLNYTRPYAGAEFQKSVFGTKGDFREYSLKAGGFINKNDWQDITLLASASLFSRLLLWKNIKIRQSAAIGYTTILNQKITMPLRIDNQFGIDRFKSDSIVGTQRLGMKTETLFFIPPTLLGFHFAPLLFAEMAMMAPKGTVLMRQQPYFALGGGVRTRNENLIFGTIELRFYYFPRVTEDLSQFKITLSSNLKVKYSSGFVNAPSFIRYN
ncbi:MAG: hypothetical protein WAZ98_06850 [Cyclobacteriaceae bacterium]